MDPVKGLIWYALLKGARQGLTRRKPTSVAGFNSILKELYTKPMLDQLYGRSFLFDTIKGDDNFQGRKIKFEVEPGTIYPQSHQGQQGKEVHRLRVDPGRPYRLPSWYHGAMAMLPHFSRRPDSR